MAEVFVDFEVTPIVTIITSQNVQSEIPENNVCISVTLPSQ